MDAISQMIRPLPQTPSPSAGAASAAKPSESSGKPDDAPAFAPAEQASKAATEKPSDSKDVKPSEANDAKPSEAKDVNPSETKDVTPSQAGGETATASNAPQDQAASAGQAELAAANALLIAQQAAATPTTPAAAPLVAPVVATTPQAPAAAAKKTDAATAIESVANKSAQPTPTTTAASPSAPQAPTAAAQPTPQAEASSQQPAKPGTAPTPTPASAAPQQDVGDGKAASAGKPNALNALLDTAKPQAQPQAPQQPQSTAPQQPTTPQPQNAAAAQPAGAQPSQATQVAQLATSESGANALADQPDTDAPAPARAATDMPAAPAVSFGTDPGASAHVKTATAAYEAARAATPILPASEQVAMQIHRAIDDGVDKLTVELKPAALGRVSAEIEFHDDHRVHVVLSADRPATLDALRNDSRALERALQDAGLRADAGSLSFRFENGGGQSNFKPDGSPAGYAAPAVSAERDKAPIALAAYASMARPGGVDLRV